MIKENKPCPAGVTFYSVWLVDSIIFNTKTYVNVKTKIELK